MASCPKCGHRPMTKRKSDGRPACPHCGPMPFPGTFAIRFAETTPESPQPCQTRPARNNTEVRCPICADRAHPCERYETATLQHKDTPNE